jgi:hypothetical protein
MTLGVSSNCNPKHISVFLTNVLDEVQGAGKASLGRGPFFFSRGRVSTESDDISDSPVKTLLESVSDGCYWITVFFHVGACQVHIG